jgi:uncharacterized protein (DUF1800 family)
MNPALRALNRFGLGARVGEAPRLDDPRGWLHEQLERADATLSDPALPTLARADEALRGVREAQQSGDQERTRAARMRLQRIRQAEVEAAMSRRVSTEEPFVERLVAFWSNHLCVSVAAKQPVIPMAGLYEREVIRPHVLGRFADMVLASARHPAMLYYLDNFQSVGPTSPGARLQARRQGRQRGLNENYARELMELHTLGVDGGYTQHDVEQMARILTGWTILGLGPQDPGTTGFVFRPALHEPGAKTVLGVTYTQDGQREGESAIRDLCAHPSTARFVATKLVRHFVSDEPPAAAVDAVSDAFRSSDGDLKVVAGVLPNLDAAWTAESRKLRTPQDWLVAVMRSVQAREVPPAFGQLLQQLRHPFWAPEAPKGFSDVASDWADPDSLMNRAELARTLAKRITRSGLEPSRLLEVVEDDHDGALRTLLSDTSIAADERVALAFGGPAFQWR